MAWLFDGWLSTLYMQPSNHQAIKQSNHQAIISEYLVRDEEINNLILKNSELLGRQVRMEAHKRASILFVFKNIYLGENRLFTR